MVCTGPTGGDANVRQAGQHRVLAEVAVSIDKARYERAAVEVNGVVGAANTRFQIGPVANGNNDPVEYGYSLGSGLCVVHRDHRSARVQRIGRQVRRWPVVGRTRRYNDNGGKNQA